jgi:radical SAM protein with 4Fe4S-binding SPASM domain
MPKKTADTQPHLRAPESIGWETTLRCNMRCRHCGSTAGEARHDELNTRQALAFVKQCIDMRVGRVVLTGGETLLRPDWKKLAQTILDGGVDCGMLSNGWLFNRRVLNDILSFRGTGFHMLVSLDGTPEIHDTVRCLKGSFKRAFDGCAHLIANGIPTGIITTVHSANIDCLPELRDLMLNRLHPYVWQIQISTPFGRAQVNNECTIGPEDYRRLSRFIIETRKMAKGSGTEIATGDCVGYLGKTEGKLRDGPWQGCQAGLMILGIQSNGNVKGCLSIIDDKFIEGNVMEEGLERIWNRAGNFAYTRRFKTSDLKGDCKGCEVGKQCRGGCSASSISVFSTPHHAPYCLRIMESKQTVHVKKQVKSNIYA